jgi:hypothetical protein
MGSPFYKNEMMSGLRSKRWGRLKQFPCRNFHSEIIKWNQYLVWRICGFLAGGGSHCKNYRRPVSLKSGRLAIGFSGTRLCPRQLPCLPAGDDKVCCRYARMIESRWLMTVVMRRIGSSVTCAFFRLMRS